jgi:hypothetical protein
MNHTHYAILARCGSYGAAAIYCRTMAADYPRIAEEYTALAEDFERGAEEPCLITS